MDAIADPQAQDPPVAKIVIRTDQLAKFRRLKGIKTDGEFAQLIGVDAAQVSRVQTGKAAPGVKYIAGVLDVFGIECFADLFAIEADQ